MKVSCKITTVLAAIFALVLILFVQAGLSLPVSVEAQAAEQFEITKYVVDMDIHEDGNIDVTENITVEFYSTSYNRGIIRDLPIKDGILYDNIKVTADTDDFSPYQQDDDSDFLSIYMRGDGYVAGKTITYTLDYIMRLQEMKEGYLPLDVIGYGWTCHIGEVSASITVPALPIEYGGTPGYKVYSGYHGTTGNDCNVQVSLQDKTYTLTTEELGRSSGITFDLLFASGAISNAVDPWVWYALAFTAVLVVAAIFIKLASGKKPVIPVVNLTAPDEMDSMKMGYIIDHSVNSEDLGSLIFWLADQGYLAIDFEGVDPATCDNPLIVKTEKPLAEDLPDHVRILYNGLFKNRDKLHVKDLEYSFYTTADLVKSSVRTSVPYHFYEKKSHTKQILLGLLAVALSALFVLARGFTCFFGYLNIGVIVAGVIGCAACYVISNQANENRFKWTKTLKLGMKFATVAVIALMALLPFIMRDACGGWYTYGVALVGAGIFAAFAGSLKQPSEEYRKQLGDVLGFKNFILYTEKDKIAFMLQENPELYYHILPYAQVLGVSDEWSEKFKGLDMSAPSYARGYYGGDIFDCIMYSHMFRALNRSMTMAMVSKPSSNGSGHNTFGGGGGFSGGFGGGGFGGGGGRGC